MTEEFQRGDEVCKAMEDNKADWTMLFEQYPFFESYKNYLQINISAENEDHFRQWHGWVESRLRILTLKIEKHTYNRLQVHPYPGSFSDKTKPHSCSFFMGLQRIQVPETDESQKGQKLFDMRATVEEFKKLVHTYTMWRDGMEVHISHVKHKDIPSFVFPGGIRRPRTTRPVRPARRNPSDVATAVMGEVSGMPTESSERKNLPCLGLNAVAGNNLGASEEVESSSTVKDIGISSVTEPVAETSAESAPTIVTTPPVTDASDKDGGKMQNEISSKSNVSSSLKRKYQELEAPELVPAFYGLYAAAPQNTQRKALKLKLTTIKTRPLIT